MDLTVAYRGRSAVVDSPAGLAVALAPNLRRDRVSFDAGLGDPPRFREAIGALHDVVVDDRRRKPKDREALEAYRAREKAREDAIRRGVEAQMRQTLAKAEPALSGGGFARLEASYRKRRAQYWSARQKYSDYLMTYDRGLWRLMMPCDPVITVAPDVVFFECFSADESSYGCLTVDRGAFLDEQDASLGTTNVDYSWALYEHFQRLRSYRPTRFQIDPTGFEVAIADAGESYREEKIDLPTGWLRGFSTLQSAMSLPSRQVSIGREGLYNVLGFLKRNRAKHGPRALRFELEPGKAATIVLEPWEARFPTHGKPYKGPKAETIRVWGRDRLLTLARLLPLLDEAGVYLLGTGLPSFWSTRMGGIRLLLGLSGWTANDWTGGSSLAQLAPPAEPSRYLVEQVAASFRAEPSRTLDQITAQTGGPKPEVLAALNRLSGLGQVIHDLHAGVYRWRPVMPVALSAELIGPEDPEAVAARGMLQAVQITRDQATDARERILEGKVAYRPVSLLLDPDGRMVRGRCTCSHYHTGGLRKGPCRHLQALRDKAMSSPAGPTTLAEWFAALRN